MNFPIISLVVPVYNVAPYLSRCLDSLISQKYPSLEIICVNDGSTDLSGSILNLYAKKDPRIKIISQPNQGLSAARNTGIRSATGEWMGFIDSDDYITPDCISKIAQHISNDIDLICWGATAVKQNSEEDIFWLDVQNQHLRLRFKGKKRFTQRVALKTPVTVWNKLFRKSILKQYQITFPQGLLFEDNAFYWKYFPFCKRAYFIQEPFYFYTQRVHSIMGRLFSMSLPPHANGCKIGQDIIQFYKQHGLFKSHQKLLQKLFFGLFRLDFDHTSSAGRKETLKTAAVLLTQSEFSSLTNTSRAILSQDETHVHDVQNANFWEKLFSISKDDNGKKYIYILGIRLWI